jgi:integrase/recombinase XerD
MRKKKNRMGGAGEEQIHPDNKQIDLFLLHLELEKSLSENTVKSYEFDLHKFKDFLNSLKIFSFTDVDENHIEKFLAYLRKEYKSSSGARILSAIRQFYDFMLDNGYLVKKGYNPFENFDAPGFERKLSLYYLIKNENP